MLESRDDPYAIVSASWMFSRICCSARAPAGPRSRTPRSAATGVSRFPAGPARGPRDRRGRGVPVGRRARGRDPCCPATSCSCAGPSSTTWPTRPAAACIPFRRPAARPRAAARGGSSRGDGPASVRFFCGAYDFEGDLCARLLDALPDLSGCARRRASQPARDDGPARRARCCTTPRASRRCSTGCSTSPSCRSCASTSPRRRGAAAGWFRASGDPQLGAGAARRARRPGAPMDGRRPRRRGDAVARGVRAALHRAARRRPRSRT